MEKRQYKQMIYELTDNLISVCAVGYIKAENAIKPVTDFIVLSVKKIRVMYAFCELYISTARETFVMRNRLKKLKSSAS